MAILGFISLFVILQHACLCFMMTSCCVLLRFAGLMEGVLDRHCASGAAGVEIARVHGLRLGTSCPVDVHTIVQEFLALVAGPHSPALQVETALQSL